MKGILLLLLAGSFACGIPAPLYAQTYRILQIKGDCKVREAETWRTLDLNDVLTPASTLRGGVGGAQLYIRDSDPLTCYQIKLTFSDFPLSTLSEQSNSALASFSKIVLSRVPESVISLADSGVGFRGDEKSAVTESHLFGSLCRKMQGKPQFDRLSDRLSDYPIVMTASRDEATGVQRILLTSFHDTALCIGLFLLSKNPYGDEELTPLDDNVLFALPACSVMEIAADCTGRIIALAAEEPFVCSEVAELLTSSNGRTTTTLSFYRVGVAVTE